MAMHLEEFSVFSRVPLGYYREEKRGRKKKKEDRSYLPEGGEKCSLSFQFPTKVLVCSYTGKFSDLIQTLKPSC